MENSFLWSTNGLGDGSSEYTQSDWSTIQQIQNSVFTAEGISPVYGFYLQPIIDTDLVIRTGVAVVDGKPYINTGNVSFIPRTPVGGGNTRIDLIVLRADWSAQTVRLTLVEGIDAGSPVAPALESTPGTLVDVLICTIDVANDGSYTFTDDRVLSQVNQASLAFNSVTDSHTGVAVPFLNSRNGDSTTHWNTGVAGPGTDYGISTRVEMQAGVQRLAFVGTSNNMSISVTFPNEYLYKPLVFPSIVYQNPLDTGDFSFSISVESVTTEDCGIRVIRVGTLASWTIDIAWLAIGPAANA